MAREEQAGQVLRCECGTFVVCPKQMGVKAGRPVARAAEAPSPEEVWADATRPRPLRKRGSPSPAFEFLFIVPSAAFLVAVIQTSPLAAVFAGFPVLIFILAMATSGTAKRVLAILYAIMTGLIALIFLSLWLFGMSRGGHIRDATGWILLGSSVVAAWCGVVYVTACFSRRHPGG